MIEIIYYAHSMTDYDSEKEQHELDLLKSFFWHGLTFNPNCPWIQTSSSPMQLCLSIVTGGQITGVAFSTNSGRVMSQGVYAEVRAAQKSCLPVYEIGQDTICPFSGFIELTKKDRKRNWARVF